MEIIMLVDYRGQFYSSQRSSTIGMDIDRITKHLKDGGVRIEVIPFSSIDWSLDYKGKYVVYQSSEDRGLLYKSYISDVLLGLNDRGAFIIPKYQYFHAHHNKSFQEIIRKNICVSGVKSIKSDSYGCFEDFMKSDLSNIEYPVVIKDSEGCCSKSVLLVKNEKELVKSVKSLSRSFNFRDALRFFAKRFLRKDYIPESLNRNKFILQQFIPNLAGDYKVLVYGDKYYVLSRLNRKGDFRASGSGIFNFPEQIPKEVLITSKAIKEFFNVPYVSLDIAYDSETDTCFLIEFQFLMFGTYTLEASKFYFLNQGDEWRRVEGESILEDVFADSLLQYIRNNFSYN